MGYPYYAVRKGKAACVVTSWRECQELTSGYPGAEFKGFNTEPEAQEYVKTGKVPMGSAAKVEKPVEGHVNIYERGSEAAGMSQMGIVVETPTQVFNFFGEVDSKEYSALGGISGELLAVMTGIQLAKDLGFSLVNIVYSYDGVERWYDGTWMAKGQLQNEYVALLNNFRLGLDMQYTFQKVSSKSRNPGVNLAVKMVSRAGKQHQYVDLDKILRGIITVRDVPLYSVSKSLIT